jgi:Mrp family chromosome partitioning ATPase
MERTADPLHDARALEPNGFDGTLPERGGAAAAVEPLGRRAHARARWTRDTQDRSAAGPDASTAAATAAATAPRRTSSSGRVVRPPSTVAEQHHQHLAGLVYHLFVETGTHEAPIRSVMFMAVESGRDVALLPAAAAEILAARVAGRICLVDAEVAAPSLHRHYGVINEQGLLNGLSDDTPISRSARLLAQGHESSLWLVPSGSGTSEAAVSIHDVFAAPASVGRIRELIAAFDYALIAGPAIGRNGAASTIGAAVDGVVLVAEANVTSRQDVRAAADRLRAAGAHVLGTVLNNRVFPIPEALYRLL